MEILSKLILGGAKHQNNKQQPRNNKEARATSTVSLFLTLSLTLHILMSLILTLNIFHILHDVKNAKIRAFYWKKERKLSLTDANLSVFPPEYKKIKKISVNKKQVRPGGSYSLFNLPYSPSSPISSTSVRKLTTMLHPIVTSESNKAEWKFQLASYPKS